MSEVKVMTDELKERVLYLSSFGIPGQEIANTIGISAKSTVNNLIRIAKAVEEDRIEDARQISISCHCPGHFDWAMKKYGKKLPEPKPVPKFIQETQQKMDMAEIKRVVTDAIAENCKDAKIEQIDKDQMARIMLALGKITDALAEISLKMEECQKTTNANADNLYSLVTNMNNSVILEMRKRKQIK